MPPERIVLVLSNAEIARLLERAVLSPAGYAVELVSDWSSAEKVLQSEAPSLVILGDKLEERVTDELAASLFERFPFVPVILLPTTPSDAQEIEALRKGYADYLRLPLHIQEVESVVGRALERSRKWHDLVRKETKKDTRSLERRIATLEGIQRVGRKVASLLDLDNILTTVVDAAVELTGAEEGSLLLVDESTGELYMRAGRNFQDDFVRTFRMPIHASPAGEVLASGKPLWIDASTPQKIKTAYLVYSLIYVPIVVKERVIGVLGVDNRQVRKSFSDYHIALVSALAEYASIAIENARLYSRSEAERNRFESILTKIEEGVIVVDHESRVILINRKACDIFGIMGDDLEGRRVREVIQHPELVEVLREDSPPIPSRLEIGLEDGRVFHAQVTPIPEIGIVVTMQDITHLKELDRIKTDFVNTVSHDLRSPLTAILGYVELLDRVGTLNEQQKEFIRRVQISVQNITSLINDLLDLGRIEAGFDVRKEIVPISIIIQYAVDGLRGRAADKQQSLTLDLPENLPRVLGNPIRLRQMLGNLIGNAIKFTPASGRITVSGRQEGGQVILQVADNGPGIPSSDQPYIFDKFYRASNVPADTPGTGLGLAIVKSIVENHQGRIWVDSTLGQGTTFTVVLPIADQTL